MQAGINHVPAQTRYCLQINTQDPHHTSDTADTVRWPVTLTEYPPSLDPAPRVFTQLITTRTVGGHTLITTIEPRPAPAPAYS